VNDSTLHKLASEATRCDACFGPGQLKRSFVDVPQPRYIGPKYATSAPRMCWLMINPGAGDADASNRSWRSVLVEFRQGNSTLAAVFQEQRRHMPTWNSLMPFIAKHGLSVDRLALVNVAWCATQGNRYPRDMLERCFDKHTSGWLIVLDPEVLVLSGSTTHSFEPRLQQILPKAKFIRTFHYAHRKPDAQRANARAVEVRKELGL